MNLLFANLYWDYGRDASSENVRHLQFPTGLAIIAAEIQENRNDELFVVDNYISRFTDDDVLNFISTNEIDCILLSAYLGNYQYLYLKQFVNKITEHFPKCRIIIGGPLASTVAGVFLANIRGGDEQVVMVIGEGEKTIIDLLHCFEMKGSLSKVEGISFVKNAKIIQTPERARIQDLDQHPYPAYDLFDIKTYVEYTQSTNRCWELCSSRGCYGRCVYCKRVFGNRITMKSADFIVREMEDLFTRYDIDRFNFVDDNFLNSEKQVYNFFEALQKSDLRFNWRFQGRADRFTPKMARDLVKVGLYDISFGIESGSPVILKEMNKMLDTGIARQNLKNLPPELDRHASFIVGMPGESHETVDQTIRFIRDVGLRNINAGILTVFPGTPLYDRVKKSGFIKNDDEYCSRLGPVYVYPYINLTSYPDDQLLRWRDLISMAG